MTNPKDARTLDVPPAEGFIRLSVHWFRFRADYSRALALVRKWFPGRWTWEDGHHGLWWKDKRLKGPHGLSLNFDVGEAGPCACVVEMPGEACEVLGPYLWLIMQQQVAAVDVLRVDVAFDGWTDEEGKPIDPVWVDEMIREDPSFIRSRADRAKIELRRKGKHSTVYIGSRSSERFLRIYNERGYTRAELQLGGRFARAYVDGIACGCSSRQTSFSYLRSHVDFIEPEANSTRAELQPWWRKHVERWDLAVIPGRQKPETLDRKYLWLVKAVAPTLAQVVAASTGDVDVVHQLLAIGFASMTARHEGLISDNPGWVAPLLGEVRGGGAAASG